MWWHIASLDEQRIVMMQLHGGPDMECEGQYIMALGIKLYKSTKWQNFRIRREHNGYTRLSSNFPFLTLREI